MSENESSEPFHSSGSYFSEEDVEGIMQELEQQGTKVDSQYLNSVKPCRQVSPSRIQSQVHEVACQVMRRPTLVSSQPVIPTHSQPPAVQGPSSSSQCTFNVLQPSNEPKCDKSNTNQEYPGDLTTNRRRQRKPNPNTWNQNVNCQKRMSGESYTGYERKKGSCKKVQRKVRSIGSRCTSVKCLKANNRFCDRFNEQSRQQIYSEFWKNMDWNQKRAYVISLVDTRAPFRRTTKQPSRRADTLQFYLKLNGEKRQVCRVMFLNTLGIGDFQMRDWVKHKKFTRKKSDCPKSANQNKQIVVEYLNTLPKIPSHYCRSSSSKLYLEPPFSSKSDIFRAYKSYCSTEEMKSISRKTFNAIVDEMNIAIFMPRKDRCDTCCSFEAGNLEIEDYDRHIEKKDMAQQEKAKDKEIGILGQAHVITMDLQAVKVSPLLNASALYYKTKLLVHNFTVYDLATSDVSCFIWDETEAGLVASVFATCILRNISQYDDDKPIIIYSDGCVHQNRNAMLSSALLNHAVTKKKTITQKFLEKGHTMMEVESVHSAIERKLKGRRIYLPTDYVNVCKEARLSPHPYNVEYIRHPEIYNFAHRPSQRYASIKPSNGSGGFCVTDIRQLRYNPSGTIDFKINHNDSEWQSLPRTPRREVEDVPKLYSSRLTVTKRKFQDLQDLLPVLPIIHEGENCHDYYKDLPFK